jgi:hypothetical protein
MSLSTPSTSVPSLVAGPHDATSQAALAARRKTFRAPARAECYHVGHPDPFPESVRRLQAYGAAELTCSSPLVRRIARK